MGKIDVKQEREVACSASKAWEVIGPGFVSISSWGRGVNKSWKNEDLQTRFVEAPAGGRYCDAAGFGLVDERIVHYSSDNYEISWTASADKMPGFLTNLQNQLAVKPVDDNHCIIQSNITADLSGFMGFIMKPMFNGNFNKLLKGFLYDWKIYAETGDVSEVKKKELG